MATATIIGVSYAAFLDHLFFPFLHTAFFRILSRLVLANYSRENDLIDGGEGRGAVLSGLVSQAIWRTVDIGTLDGRAWR